MSLYSFFKKYGQSNLVAILLLSFSSGLPLALVSSTLQAWYTTAGLSLLTIGFLSFTGQAYLYKFLWAPLVDRYTFFTFLGRRKAWILLMQLSISAVLATMAFLHPENTPWALAFLALIVAFLSATQDIAFDAYRTDVLGSEERGLGSSMNVIGYRLAMLVSGSLVLVIAARSNFQVAYLFMSAIMLAVALFTFYAPKPATTPGPMKLSAAIQDPLREFFSRKNAVAIIIFIIIYKLCDAFALSLNTTFLIRGVGFTLIEIGLIAKSVSLSAALLGGLIGGILLPRLGLYRSLMIFGILQMLANLSFVWLALMGKNILLMANCLFIENFCSGLSSVAFVVFLMSLCDKRYTAVQYALFSALMSLGRIIVGPEAAVMVEHLGWVQFYLWTCVIGLPALMVLRYLNQRMDFRKSELVSFG